MDIKLSPFRSDDELTVVKQGDVLTLNGESFDFNPMGDGDTLPLEAVTSQWFGDSVNRTNGTLVLTLRLPIPANFSQAQAYPVPLFNVPDGVVELPASLPTTFVTAQVDQ